MVLFFILPFSVCLHGNDIEKTMLENAGLKLEVRKEYMYKRETFFNYSMVTKIMYFTLAKQELNTLPNTEHLIKMFHLRIGPGGREIRNSGFFFRIAVRSRSWQVDQQLFTFHRASQLPSSHFYMNQENDIYSTCSHQMKSTLWTELRETPRTNYAVIKMNILSLSKTTVIV